MQKNTSIKPYPKAKLLLLLITANNPLAVEGFLQYSLAHLNQWGINLVVFDSSNDDRTQNITERYSNKYSNLLYDRYVGEQDKNSIDVKVLSAYKKYSRQYEYLWAIRDGLVLYPDNSLKGLLPLLSHGNDFIIVDLHIRDIYRYGTKKYNKAEVLFREQVANMNTLGLVVVSSSFITRVMKEIPLSDATYGMYQPIAFFHYYATHTPKVILYTSNIWAGNPTSSGSCVHFWSKKLLWQWGKRWFELIDGLPAIYNPYKSVVWHVKTFDFEPFSWRTLLQTKKQGGLTLALLWRYKKYLPYVSKIPFWKLCLFALTPYYVIDRSFSIYRNYKHFMKKHIYKHLKFLNKYD